MLYDVSSSYYEGRTCPLARFGHDRDGKNGLPIIVYGVLTDAEGRPVAVDVYPATPAIPRRCPTRSRPCARASGWRTWCWSGDRGCSRRRGSSSSPRIRAWAGSPRCAARRFARSSRAGRCSCRSLTSSISRRSRRPPTRANASSRASIRSGGRAPPQTRRVARRDRARPGDAGADGGAAQPHALRRGHARPESGADSSITTRWRNTSTWRSTAGASPGHDARPRSSAKRNSMASM